MLLSGIANHEAQAGFQYRAHRIFTRNSIELFRDLFLLVLAS